MDKDEFAQVAVSAGLDMNIQSEYNLYQLLSSGGMS